MPHAVVQGTLDLAGLAPALEPIMEKRQDGILKTTGHFLATDGSAILVEALAIEGGQKRPFLALISRRDDGAVVRLHPLSDDVEKTDGVQRILALLAMQLLGTDPELSLGKTNLEDHLDL